MSKQHGPWGQSDLMAVCAVDYCLGRQTYIVGMCADWLEENWCKFSPKACDLIQRRVEEAFSKDDEARVTGGRFALGSDCDRRDWERVRKLWRTT